MDNYYQKSGSKFNPDIYSTPTRDKLRPTTPIYLLQQNNEEQYVKNLMTNLSSYLTTKEPNYDNLNNLLLPKDVNYYFTEKTKVIEMVDRCYSKQKQVVEELIDDFLKQIILSAEAAKGEIYDILENEKKAYYDFYDKFSRKIEGFLEQAGHKINTSMQNYKSYVNNIGREFSDPLEFELSRIKLEKRRFEEIETIFNVIRKDYTMSSIPEEKKVLEAFFSESKLPDSKVDADVITLNLKSLTAHITGRVKEIHKEETSPKVTIKNLRPPSNSLNNNLQSSMIQRLNNFNNEKHARTGLTPVKNLTNIISHIPVDSLKHHTNDDRPDSITNLNLVGSGTKVNKDITFKLPEPEKEMDKLNMMTDKLKHNNINININNIPYNNTPFINVYNQQNQLRQAMKTGTTRDYYNTNKVDINANLAELRAKRPQSSIVTTQLNPINTSVNNANNSFSKNNGRSMNPVVSLTHTNLFTRFSVPCNKYTSDTLINDNLSSITCFEVSTEGSELYYGTKNGDVIAYKVNTDIVQVTDVRKARFSASVLFISEIQNHIVVSLNSTSGNLMLLDGSSLNVLVEYKTCNEKIKAIAFHTADKFIAVNSDNRLFLYEMKKNSPIKSFRVTEQNIIDAVMASNNLLFTASDKGEIKSFKVSFETNTMVLEGKIDLQCKIKNLEIFHNNEKLLIVNAERNKKSEVIIINLITKKVMNTITDPLQDHITAVLTFTIVKRPPEIFLIAFGSKRVSYCDIDKQTLESEIRVENGRAINLRSNLDNGTKKAKIMAQELKSNTYVIGLGNNGLNLIKIN